MEVKKERQLTTIYSRVVGWITPTANFNKGKAEEFKDRKVYRVDKDKL